VGKESHIVRFKHMNIINTIRRRVLGLKVFDVLDFRIRFLRAMLASEKAKSYDKGFLNHIKMNLGGLIMQRNKKREEIERWLEKEQYKSSSQGTGAIAGEDNIVYTEQISTSALSAGDMLAVSAEGRVRRVGAGDEIIGRVEQIDENGGDGHAVIVRLSAGGYVNIGIDIAAEPPIGRLP